ncbi:2'-5' RNA ligase family protein [Anabaena sp. UHCC 0204]|uniref:2'-5' RNA ligase family protein n=1 Tax=Anabaena sp. UHCC 0204 TaxID=2590009 RepID=UPI001445E62A|nr:hypothetical protein [Anabaena sp. UHCC 0204]MTJ07719.1 hypothetical protein [Anabaena sp. UHCC 0204]
MDRFFIALLPPQHIQEYANSIKQYFADKYASRSAQKSPPHITLQPPFEWPDNAVSNLGIIDQVSKTSPFVPHLTVAFRDLTKQNFRTAWPEFVQRQLHFEYTATHLTLLIHNGKCWNIKSKFAFCPTL